MSENAIDNENIRKPALDTAKSKGAPKPAKKAGRCQEGTRIGARKRKSDAPASV